METPLLENPAQPPNPHPTTHSPNQVKFELSWGVDPGGGDQATQRHRGKSKNSLKSSIQQLFILKPLRAGEAAWFWSEDDVLYVLSGPGGVRARIVDWELTRQGVIYSVDTVLVLPPSRATTSQTFQLTV